MDMLDYMIRPGEKPLDRIVPDGGFCGIFRRFAVIGDSLSSGEFEALDGQGGKTYHDLFEYSWGQYMARAMGSVCHSFSRGGMTAREYMDSFAALRGFWDPALAAQMYIVALGVNDISVAMGEGTGLGSLQDIRDDWRMNARTFAGHYGAIIQRYRLIAPDSKFFLMTIPDDTFDEPPRKALNAAHRALLQGMAERFPNTYLLEFDRYAPVYDEEFHRRFFLNGHLDPAGYLLTARMVMSYIDYIVRARPEDFAEVGLIGTPYKNHRGE